MPDGLSARAAPPPAAPAARRALVPHEHGAWGQLAMPLVTGLAIGRPGAAALALAAAAVLAFVAHEPLLVVLGARGVRARAEDGPRARRWLLALVGAAAAAGAAGLALAPPAARGAALLSVLLGGAVAVLVVRKLEKTIAGEMLVATALASSGFAVALAGGVSLRDAAAAWLAWSLAFAAATLAVHVILARARSKGRRDPGLAHAVAAAALVAAAFPLAAWMGAPRAAPLAVLPTGILSVAVCLLRISARRLRELGWAMVGSSVLTFALLVAGLR